MKIFLDIESTSLKADIGQIIALGLIKYDKTEVKFVDSVKEEKEVLEWLKKELEGCDLIISWFGSGFDIPFIISRAMINEVDLHEILRIPSLDLCKFCQQNLSLSNYSLVEVAKFFGIRKEEISGKDMLSYYMEAVRGNKRAREIIVEHCIDDLKTLKKIYEKIEPYIVFVKRNSWVKNSS